MPPITLLTDVVSRCRLLAAHGLTSCLSVRTQPLTATGAPSQTSAMPCHACFLNLIIRLHEGASVKWGDEEMSSMLGVRQGSSEGPALFLLLLQAGFRLRRGTRDAFFALILGLKKRREHGQDSWVCFLDLINAGIRFDSVPRKLLFDCCTKLQSRPARPLHQPDHSTARRSIGQTR